MNDEKMTGEWSREDGQPATNYGQQGYNQQAYNQYNNPGYQNNAMNGNVGAGAYAAGNSGTQYNNYGGGMTMNNGNYQNYSAHGVGAQAAVPTIENDNMAAANLAAPKVKTIIKRKKSDSFLGMVVLFAMSVVAVVFMGLFVWSYLGWHELRTTTEKTVSDRVEAMKREVTQKMSREFEEREKEPNRTFSGPVDYGELSFAYPKTWSSYIANEAADGGDFEAYFKPGVVPSVKDKGIFALRVKIVNKTFDKMVDSYRQDKKLKLSTRTVNGRGTNHYEGTTSDGLKIQMVLIKLRDKTAVLRTDAEVYKADFEKILKTVKFKE